MSKNPERLSVKSKKEKDFITEIEIHNQIVESGQLPSSLEVSLADYLHICEFPLSVFRADGLYYKGIRVIIKNHD